MIPTLLGLWLIATVAPARAVLYSFTEIASTQSLGESSVNGASINASGRVAFTVTLPTGDRVYLAGTAGALDTIFTSQAQSASVEAIINDAGDVAFIPNRTDRILKYDAGLDALRGALSGEYQARIDPGGAHGRDVHLATGRQDLGVHGAVEHQNFMPPTKI